VRLSYATEQSTEPAAARTANKVATGRLRTAAPNDSYEHEADRVANDIMSGGALRRHWSLSTMGVSAPLQRKCSCGGSAGTSGECEECTKKEEGQQSVQRKAASRSAEPGIAPAIVHEALNSPGQPLPLASRKFFEARFGHDLKDVRIHTDAPAIESARRVNALAYTVGRDVVFGDRQHAPHTFAGRRLLAHELAHVVQQSGQPQFSLQRQSVGGPLDLTLDPCITDIPVVGKVCGQSAAKVCSTQPSLPGCSAVCKVFSCEKHREPHTLCPPGFHAAASRDFAGQCCPRTTETASECCPPDRIAIGPGGSKCCTENEVVQGGACVPSSAIPLGPMPCVPPARSTLTGKCCLPPLVPGVTECESPQIPEKPAASVDRPTGPVIINFVLDRPRSAESTGGLNSSLTSAGKAALKDLITQLKTNPTWKVQLVGRASPEGTPDYNMSLSARRAQVIARALSSAGIDNARVADAPSSSLPGGCESLDAGLKSCGEIGSKGESDRQVAATLFVP
jgi:hypothetical protein